MPEKTIETISRTARDQYERALAALERNNLDYAIEMFNQCLGSEPNFPGGRKFLRATQLKRADQTSSFKRMLLGAKLTPLLTKTKMAVGKNPLDALGLAEQVLNEDPRNGQALLMLAEAADNLQFHETTIQTLDHYSKLNPKDTKSLHWMARAHTKLERYDLALEVVRGTETSAQ